jgi:hypothetical protein
MSIILEDSSFGGMCKTDDILFDCLEMCTGVSRPELQRQASQVAPASPFTARLSEAVSFRRDSASEHPNMDNSVAGTSEVSRCCKVGDCSHSTLTVS